MLVFCPLELEGISPLIRYHVYPLGLIRGDLDMQVNVTSFNALTAALDGLASTPVIKNIC